MATKDSIEGPDLGDELAQFHAKAKARRKSRQKRVQYQFLFKAGAFLIMLMVVMISKKIQQWRPFVMRCPNVRVHYIGASLNKCGQAATVAGTNQKTLETFLLRQPKGNRMVRNRELNLMLQQICLFCWYFDWKCWGLGTNLNSLTESDQFT
ncbi:unnamed protein product [Cladocopium goreaui]|nr:unnamed protein product [Cladocopium goreaui]